MLKSISCHAALIGLGFLSSFSAVLHLRAASVPDAPKVDACKESRKAHIRLSRDPSMLSRIWIALVLVALTACGGGGGGAAAPNQNPVQAVLLSSVLVPEGNEARNYSVISDTQLSYSGATPPAVGTVLLLNGSAYKVGSVTTLDGRSVIGTSPPEIEDVFESLIVGRDIPISTGATISNLPLGIEVSMPEIKVDTATSFPDFPLAANGALKNAIVHAELNYQRSSGGWQPGSELSIKGDLEFNLLARPKVGTYKTSFSIPDLNVPLAFAFGTVSVKASTRFEFKIESVITANAGALTYKRSLDSGMRRNASDWEFFDRGATVGTPTQTSDSLLGQALALLSPTAKSAMTFSVSPILAPRLSVFNDTVGILGVALKPAGKGKLELSDLEQPPCANLSSSLDFNAYALIRGPQIRIPFLPDAFQDDEVDIEGVPLPVSASVPLTGPTPVGFCSYTLAVNPPSTALEVGGTQQLSALVSASGLGLSPLALAPQPALTWSSDSPSVTVDANGLVRAVAPGSATVTVSDAKHKTSARVAVNVAGDVASGTGWYLAAWPIFQNIRCGTSWTLSLNITGDEGFSNSASYSGPSCDEASFGNSFQTPVHINGLVVGKTYNATFTWSGGGDVPGTATYEINWMKDIGPNSWNALNVTYVRSNGFAGTSSFSFVLIPCRLCE